MVVRMQDEHELTDGLLPWFVNGTLEPDEHDRVQHHVDRCEACRDSVALLSAIQSAVRRDATTPIVLPARADSLLEAIDGAGRTRGRRRVLVSSLLAASVAAVLLAGALLPGYREGADPQPVIYETMTSETRPVSMDYVFDLRFESGTTLSERTRALRELEANDVEEIEPGSTYRVTINLSVGSLEELEQYTDGIASRTRIASMEAVALQLPVKQKPMERPQ